MNSISKLGWGYLGPAFLVVLTGCVAPQDYQSQAVAGRVLVSEPVQRNVNYQGVLRNPVILIHGLFGSRLMNLATKQNVWGNFSTKKISDPEQWHQLAWAGNCDSPVSSVGLMDYSTMKLLGMSFSLTNYERVIQVLEQLGYVRDDLKLPPEKLFPSLFLFHYDWRRSVPDNVARLEKFIVAKRQFLQRRYHEVYGVSNYDVRFDVIAHSMGGLLTRYYVQYGAVPLPRDGALPPLRSPQQPHYLEKVFMVGTPNAGYLDTLLELVNGLALVSMAPSYPPALLGTFASYFCMLPQPDTLRVVVKKNHQLIPVDIFDPDVWITYRWGLADPAQDEVLKALWPELKTAAQRRQQALNLLRQQLKMARQFTWAMSQPMPRQPELYMWLFAGDAFETNSVAAVDAVTGKLQTIGQSAGDGKITACSTRFDLRMPGNKMHFFASPIPWKGIIHLGASHMGLFNSSEFYSNIGFYLLSYPTNRQRGLINYPRKK